MASKLFVPPLKRFRQPNHPVGLSPEWASKIAFASLVGQGWNYDLKTKISPSVVGTGLSKTVGRHGAATIASNDTSGLFWGGRRLLANGNDGYAMLFLAAPVSQAEGDRAIVIGSESAGDSYNQITFIFNADKDAAVTAGKFAILEYNSAFANRADSTAGQVDGNWHVFIANRPSGAVAQRLYRDGLDVTGTQASASGVATTAGISVLCSPASTSAGFEHPASLAVVFFAPLSTSDINTLSANPWAILESQPRQIYVASAGGGSVGSSDGIAAVSGTGASTAASPGSSAGIAAVSGVGASTTAGEGSSSGVAAVSGIGAATSASTGASDGVAVVSGTGISTAASTGSSSGVAVVTGVSPAATDTGVGASSGVAVVTGVGASAVEAIGSSVGVATVIGISPVISAESASNWQEYPKSNLWSRKELENDSSEEESKIIIELAERQVTDLQITEKERKEQLKRELKLKNIEFDLKHLDALNAQRQLMIDAEIAKLMKIAQIEAENEEYLELLMLAAAA